MRRTVAVEAVVVVDPKLYFFGKFVEHDDGPVKQYIRPPELAHATQAPLPDAPPIRQSALFAGQRSLSASLALLRLPPATALRDTSHLRPLPVGPPPSRRKK